MADAIIFSLVFVGFFVLRGIAASVVFYYLLPDSTNCPHCDAVTLRVESRVWNALVPRLRSSWCIDCGWHGMLRSQQHEKPASRINERIGVDRF